MLLSMPLPLLLLLGADGADARYLFHVRQLYNAERKMNSMAT